MLGTEVSRRANPGLHCSSSLGGFGCGIALRGILGELGFFAL